MRTFLKKAILVLTLHVVVGQPLWAAADGTKKILVIGVDGIINTAIDYATTPGIDKLIANASYSMNGFSGVPAYASTGWATMLTGVSVGKHHVTANRSFEGNQFSLYPSVVTRIKSANPAMSIASVVRNAAINDLLNSAADEKFRFASDEEVFAKSEELLKQANVDVMFVQFSSPEEVGEETGFQLREARYVQAIQQIDEYVSKLHAAIQSRQNYAGEDWAIFLVSSHGGTESGAYTNNSEEEINVPIILSGASLDNKELVGNTLPPRENTDNILTINKNPSGDRTYVRVPIGGTALQGMERYTIELWVKAGSDNSSDPAIMGDKDWDSGGNPGFILCRSGSTWKINFANHKRERYDIGSSKPIEDGRWHHLAVTFDKTNECRVYQDGELVNVSPLTYKPEDNMASPFNYICFAQEGTGRYGGGGPNWSGAFNEVRIWTDVLSTETIRSYMYLRDVEDSNHPNLSSLNLYLKLDEVRGNQIRDFSGKGNHGELIGNATQRHPYYPIGLTDVAVNIMGHLGLNINGSWGLEGNALKSNVPYRLFKVN